MREVELRGKLSPAEYGRAKSELEKTDKGQPNHKLSQFFQYDGGILKVSRHESQRKTVLSLKLGDETRNSLEEFEVECTYDAFDSAVLLLEKLGHTKRETVNQRRIDYLVNDDCTISLKHTADWGYHFEAEMLVDNDQQESEARDKLSRICRKYGLQPMTEHELAEFLENIKR